MKSLEEVFRACNDTALLEIQDMLLRKEIGKLHMLIKSEMDMRSARSLLLHNFLADDLREPISEVKIIENKETSFKKDIPKLRLIPREEREE